MIFRQLFDSVSSTYTYLLASRVGGEALLLDPVFEKTDRYLKLLEELDLKLVKVVDTHVHADHITAMGALRDHTNCVTVMGEQSPVVRAHKDSAARVTAAVGSNEACKMCCRHDPLLGVRPAHVHAEGGRDRWR